MRINFKNTLRLFVTVLLIATLINVVITVPIKIIQFSVLQKNIDAKMATWGLFFRDTHMLYVQELVIKVDQSL